MNRLRTLLFASLSCALSTSLQASDWEEAFLKIQAPERTGPKNVTIRPEFEKVFPEKLDGKRFVILGVVADLEKKEVRVASMMTDAGAKEPIEFFAISELSGHSYEALAICLAKPSDIHQALEKIGLQPGEPVDPASFRFWPRGARVTASIRTILPGDDEATEFPIEQLMVTDKGKQVTPVPWVFVGSRMVPPVNDEGEIDEKADKVYASDLFSPSSIAATFNLVNTVFDLPRQMTKTAQYGLTIRNPGLPMPEAHPMILVLRPATEKEAKPDADLTIRIAPDGDGMSMLIKTDDGKEIPVDDLPGLKDDTKRWYATVDLDDNLSLSQIRSSVEALFALEAQESILIEPPPKGQLYYQAFRPREQFRNRSKRPSQPLELHLFSEKDAVHANLMLLEERWTEAIDPEIVENRVLLDKPADWNTWIGKQDKLNPVLFIYADPSISHGKILEWVSPHLDKFPVVYVYNAE